MGRPGQIRWNVRAFEALRRSPKVEAALEEHVQRILSRVGTDGYEGGVESGATRSRGYVVTTSAVAIADEAANHTLLRAFGGGST